ncbi:MAG: HAD family hydrolase [Sedimentisphaerales bacterium]|nr:HAD family hydrolase [Sedimentisphaerales bacterium]
MTTKPCPLIKAILFDLGETLINFGKVNTAALFKESARLSYEFLKQAGQPVCGFQRYYFRNVFALRVMYAWSYITGRDFDSLDLLRKIGIKRGYKLSHQQWQQFAWRWYEPLSRMATVEPDIRDTLTKLRDAGLKLGIVSNTFVTDSSLDRHLEQFGMLEFFPLRIYSYMQSRRKPNVKIFNEAARQLGLDPQEIMFVGDRLDTDIKGALNAGMTPILKTAYTNDGKNVPPAIRKINLLFELPSLVQKINSSNRTA